jgi:hypothetical protein
LFGEDFTLVPYGFRKADITNAGAFIPVDALAVSYIGSGKDLGESALGEFKDGNFANADKLAEEGKKIFDLLKKVYTAAKDNGDDKETGFNGKYSYKAVSEQLDKVLTALAETDEKLKWPEEEKKAEGDDKGKTDAAPDGEEKKEGGEKDQYEGGAGGKLADVLLAQYLESEVFADLLKSAVMSTELDSFDPLDFSKMGKGMADLTGLLPKPTDWAACCAIVDIAVQSQEAEAKDKEIWGKCKLGELDLEELKDAEAAKDKTALIFPGLSVWYAEDSGCPAPKGPEGNTEVSICVKNAKLMEKDGKSVICRFVGKIEEFKDNKLVVSEWSDYAFEKMEDYKKKFEAGAAAAGAAVDTAKDAVADGDKAGEKGKEE